MERKGEPLAVVCADWLVDPPRSYVAWGEAMSWLLFEIAYLAYTLVRGSIAHWYPYPYSFRRRRYDRLSRRRRVRMRDLRLRTRRRRNRRAIANRETAQCATKSVAISPDSSAFFEAFAYTQIAEARPGSCGMPLGDCGRP